MVPTALPPAVTIHHAREHNLKNADIRIPRNPLTVITGLSGSGKSTVAFDIVFRAGNGVRDSDFAGLETGLQYYVQAKTYFLARVEYQFFFSKTDEIDDAFKDDGAWAYTVGLGYNF